MKYIIIILSIVSCSFKAGNVCLSEVRAVFDKLNTVPSSLKEASYIHYTVTSVSGSKAGQEKPIVSKADFEMYASAKQNRVYTKEMVLLKDQQNTFAILPSRRMIYISDAVTGKKDESLYNRLKVLQDTLFRNTETVECESAEGKPYNKIVHITLNKKIADYLDIKKVSYYINTTDNTLKRVFIEYLDKKNLTSLDYVFNKTEFNHKKVDMSEPVKNLVFGSDKKLSVAYRDFKVIDNRKK